MLRRGRYADALEQIESAREKHYKAKDRVLFLLDAGMLAHYAGDWEKSNEYLTQAELAIERSFTRSVSRAAASLAVNDNLLEYAGEDYEAVWVNVFKALNYLHLKEQDSAFVEIRRADDKLKQLELRYGTLQQSVRDAAPSGLARLLGDAKSGAFRDSATARLLGMLLYAADGQQDEALIDLRKAELLWKVQPDVYDFPQPDLKERLKPARDGTVRLNLFGLAGRTPEKKAHTVYAHTEQDTLFLVYAEESGGLREYPRFFQPIFWEGLPEGWHFKFQLPLMEPSDNRVASVEVSVDGGKSVVLRKTESLENVALGTFQSRLPMIAVKTLLRSVAKTLASERAKEKMRREIGNDLAYDVLRLLLDLFSSVTENADLRMSRFFPGDIFTAGLDLMPGRHVLVLRYYDSIGQVLFEEKKEVRIAADRLNICESFYLD